MNTNELTIRVEHDAGPMEVLSAIETVVKFFGGESKDVTSDDPNVTYREYRIDRKPAE